MAMRDSFQREEKARKDFGVELIRASCREKPGPTPAPLRGAGAESIFVVSARD